MVWNWQSRYYTVIRSRKLLSCPDTIFRYTATKPKKSGQKDLSTKIQNRKCWQLFFHRSCSRLLENRTWSSTNKILIRSISFHWQVDTDADSMWEILGYTYHPVLLSKLTIKENYQNLLAYIAQSFPERHVSIVFNCSDSLFLVPPYDIFIC